MLHLLFCLCYALTILSPSYYVYYWPTFPSTELSRTYPLSQYLAAMSPLCHVTDTFLFCTDFLTCTFHSISLLLMTPLRCTTYMSSSPSSTSLILFILMCYLTVHLRVHS